MESETDFGFALRVHLFVESMPARAATKAAAEDPFSTPSHLAYSSFSHIEDLHDLSFAVGLREAGVKCCTNSRRASASVGLI